MNDFGHFYGFFGLPDARNLGVLTPSKKHLNSFRNHKEFTRVLVYLLEILLNMHKWELPVSCSPRALEYTLILHGRSLFFKDKSELSRGYGDSFLHTSVQYEGEPNIYYEYTLRRAVSSAVNYNKLYTKMDSVIIRNTFTEWPTILTVMDYAQRIADTTRTMDTYRNTLKRPWAVNAGREGKTTVDVVKDQIDGNETVVISNGNNLSAGDFKVFNNPNTPAGLLDFWVDHKNLINEFLETVGINTANTDKRERLIGAEVAANNQIDEINGGNLLRWRQQAVKEIVEMWPELEGKVSVSFNEEYLRSMESEVSTNARMDTPDA